MNDTNAATAPPARGPRTLVVGDSWVRGLSKGQGSIARLFPEQLGAAEVLDVSKISRVVPEVVADHLDEIEDFAPELALLAIGGADSLVFPAQWFQRLIDRFAPPEWAGVEGLMPPAILPRDRKKRLRKKVETFVKTLIKQFMINVFGARRRVPLDEFENSAQVLMRALDRLGVVMVVVGCSDVDHLTFPKSRKCIHATNAVLRRLAAAYPNAMYVEARSFVRKWDDYLVDRVHLTREGHQAVTAGVVAAMGAAGGPWADYVAPPASAASDGSVVPTSAAAATDASAAAARPGVRPAVAGRVVEPAV